MIAFIKQKYEEEDDLE